MRFDCVEIDGTDYRIEFNWNTVCNFLEKENKTLADLDKLPEFTPRQITSLIYLALVEGCRMDGVQFPFTIEDLGAVIGVKEIAAILNLYNRHMEVKTTVVKPKKK